MNPTNAEGFNGMAGTQHKNEWNEIKICVTVGGCRPFNIILVYSAHQE